MAKYDNNYNKVWSISFKDRLLSLPLLGDTIIVSGWSGNIFKMDHDAKILAEVNLSSGFISSPVMYKDKFFILSNNGELLGIDTKKLEIIKTIKILWELYQHLAG